METVNNAINSASNAISGNSSAEQRTTNNETAGQEPISGVKGSGSADKPFDQGNAAGSEQRTLQNETAGQEPVSGVKGAGTASKPFDQGNAQDGGNQLDGTSPSYKQPERIQPLTTNPQSSGTADSTGANVNTNPSITHHDLTPKPSDIDQASPAPPPSASEAAHKLKAGEPLTAAEREELAEQGKLPHDPNDHSGEPMKMHGGISSDSEKSDRSKSVAHEGGGEHGKETGTGKEWVKTTGFSADGGNFDASKPGAGKEANRLLEEQGIKRGVGDPKLSPGVGLPTEEKKSLADKLREKLHIGGGKHV